MLQNVVLLKSSGRVQIGDADEESKEIDGVIILDDGEILVSIKSKSYLEQGKCFLRCSRVA